jgi:subtilisin family serine protease
MNNNQGIVGVNPTAKIMAIKVGYQYEAQPFIFSDSIIKGINFATHNGANIINASL